MDKYLESKVHEQKRKTVINLTKKEYSALKELANPKITIKPADKNLGVTILNSNDYFDLCLSHLSSNTYIKTDTFPANNIRKEIEVLIKFKENLSFSNRLHRFLHPAHKHQTPRFYGLPKIHKQWNERKLPPIRPFVAHTNSLLSGSAKFLDHVLQPLAQT